MERYILRVIKEIWKTTPDNLKRFRVSGGRLIVTDAMRMLDIAVPDMADGVYGEDFLTLGAGAAFPKTDWILAQALGGTDTQEHDAIPLDFSVRPKKVFIAFQTDNTLRLGKYQAVPKASLDTSAAVDAALLAPLALLPGLQNKFQFRRRQYGPLVWTSELEGTDGAPLWRYILMPLHG